VYRFILTVLFLSFIASLTLSNISYAESEIICPSCVQIPSYEIDLYKEMFPLIVWTDSSIYDHYSIIQVNGYLNPDNNIAPIMAVVTNPIGNVVTVQQLSSDRDGNFSFELNTQSPLWAQNGDYILKVQSGTETRQFKTKFTLVTSIGDDVNKCSSDEILVLGDNNRIYCIPFKISQGIISDTDGTLDSTTKKITLHMTGNDMESVTFDIPRYVLDSKTTTGSDDVFIAMLNGEIIKYHELESDSDSRQIKLNSLSNDNTFEIIGTHIIPEFGSFVFMILIASITSVLIIGKFYSNRFVKF
jgi:predicted secreted protein with PEFG-CTERM motif